jgi:hypothetical protein
MPLSWPNKESRQEIKKILKDEFFLVRAAIIDKFPNLQNLLLNKEEIVEWNDAKQNQSYQNNHHLDMKS